VGVGNYRARDAIIDEIMREAQNDPIFISDLLADHMAAEPILAELRTSKAKKYILHFFRDEWGNVPQPGDIIKRPHKKPLKTREGLPIMGKELRAWKRSGIYEQKRYDYEYHTVDERGCITVNADDTEYFLSHYGIHSISDMPLSFHTIEHSVDPAPVKDPKTGKPTGQKLHVWYHRCKEVDAEMYKELPILKKTEKPKRGTSEYK
jgi:hypothetical protein